MDGFALFPHKIGKISVNQGVLHFYEQRFPDGALKECRMDGFRTYYAEERRGKCEMGDSALMSPGNGGKSVKWGLSHFYGPMIPRRGA